VAFTKAITSSLRLEPVLGGIIELVLVKAEGTAAARRSTLNNRMVNAKPAQTLTFLRILLSPTTMNRQDNLLDKCPKRAMGNSTIEET